MVTKEELESFTYSVLGLVGEQEGMEAEVERVAERFGLLGSEESAGLSLEEFMTVCQEDHQLSLQLDWVVGGDWQPIVLEEED